MRAGHDLRMTIFKMFQFIWTHEKKPDQWKNTLIVQIYKGKGDSDDLSNHRNIHTKEEFPKAFESGLVLKSKKNIVEGCSKFQIGAMPGHRSQEHLFSIKSVIALYVSLGITLIIQFYDVSKFFDKESLRDALDALYKAGIIGKLYRLW